MSIRLGNRECSRSKAAAPRLKVWQGDFCQECRLTEVVALACRTANVGTLPGGRIALYGDTMVNLSKSRDAVLAQNIMHMRQIFDTCLYNAHRASRR